MKKILFALIFILIASVANAASYYAHKYSNVNDLTEYSIVKHYNDGSIRIMQQHNEDEWVAGGGTVVKESGNRFIIINGDTVSLDPNMTATLATEAAAASALQAAQYQTFATNLTSYLSFSNPSWTSISSKPTTLSGFGITDAVGSSDARLTDARTPTTHSHSYEAANANIQTHVTASHAPSNAQKNSDITQAEIEAKLTGAITTHTHSGSGMGYTINVQALTSSPGDGATVYFGYLPKAPIATANVSKIYIRKAGTIKIAEIYCYSGTAGTNESWSLYIRKNNTTDTLIATLGVNTNERIFTNSSLNITVSAGDYIEIKSVQPTWATNPLTTIYGGYVYIE